MALNPSQQDSLHQLLAVTASSTPGQRERDERLLRENGWNVQATVEQIFSLESTASEVPNDTTSSSPRTSMSESGSGSGSGSRPITSRLEVEDHHPLLPRQPVGTRRLSGSQRSPRSPGGGGTTNVGLSLWSLVIWPVSIVWSIVGGIWYFIIRTFVPLSLLPRLPSFLLPPSSPSNSTNHLRPNQDPTTTSLRFIRDLEQFTRCSSTQGNLPEFYIGPYREFIQHLRKEGKLGLVVIVSSEHENDEEFKKSVLTDEEFVRTLKEKDVVVWGADISSREGYQVAQTLLLTTYPSLTFLSLLPVPNSSTPKLTILSSLSGSPSTTTSTSNIIQALTTTILPRVTPFLNRLKRERLSLEEARHLRAEQDKAFKEAERKDREKAQVQRQKEELERIQRERAEKEKKEKEIYQENKKIWRRYARRNLLSNTSTNEEGSIRIAIRTPISSERYIRNFQIKNSTLDLFIFIETLLISPEDLPENDPINPPQGFEKVEDLIWDFTIVTSFPRKEIEPTNIHGEDYWIIIKQAGGVLFVERKAGSKWGLENGEGGEDGDESDEEIIED